MVRRLLLLFLLVGGLAGLARGDSSQPAEHPDSAQAPPLSRAHQALADELRTMWTRDPERLVQVVAAARAENSPIPLSFLLAIAHAETHGKILTVSEAGAVGLAQATPIAYLEEGGQGPLFVTDDYAAGARAYFLKKPLYDVESILAALTREPGVRGRERARGLLQSAHEMREEGVEDLALLVPYVSPLHWPAVLRADEENLETLIELERLMESCSSIEELEEFRVRARERYRALREIQRVAWKRYQVDLAMRRDALIRRHFDAEPSGVIRDRAYEAAKVLSLELDERFSPWSMAAFLDRHVRTKLAQALVMGAHSEELPRLTAGLYNGGAHNIRRMRTGLLPSLPETDRYMEKVPSTQHRLEHRLRLVDAGSETGAGEASTR